MTSPIDHLNYMLFKILVRGKRCEMREYIISYIKDKFGIQTIANCTCVREKTTMKINDFIGKLLQMLSLKLSINELDSLETAIRDKLLYICPYTNIMNYKTGNMPRRILKPDQITPARLSGNDAAIAREKKYENPVKLLVPVTERSVSSSFTVLPCLSLLKHGRRTHP